MVLLDDPMNLCKALRSKDVSKWEAAMQEEYDLLMVNGTWELTKLPNDHRSVGYKWVFHTKNNALGEVIRYRICLVAKGYSQVTVSHKPPPFCVVVRVRVYGSHVIA